MFQPTNLLIHISCLFIFDTSRQKDKVLKALLRNPRIAFVMFEPSENGGPKCSKEEK